MSQDCVAVNKANWDERAPAHAASPGYEVDALLDGGKRLSDVVAFDLPRLGDIAGLDGIHLQCHIGTDTLSLARLGARMTGLDFSPAALAEARRIAERASIPIDYVESEVYAAPEALGGRTFNLVFTGIGALCWLPSIRQWAATVNALLRPGGRLFIREGHPAMWSLDDARLPDLVVNSPYFETAEGTEWDEEGTYVETDATFVANKTVEWNHGIGEIITALIDEGLVITGFEEHDSVPWLAMPGIMTMGDLGEWSLTERPERLPLTYTLQARKPD